MTAPYYEDQMVCAACAQPLTRWDRQSAMVWMDPSNQACIAHHACLQRIGEFDLSLPPTA